MSISQIGCLVVLVLVLIGVITSQAGRTSSGGSSSPAADPKSEALSKVKLVDFNWRTDGMTMTANFTVKNDNAFAVKDIEIRCDHSGKSGTVMDHNTRTIYDVVGPNATKKFRKFNMGFIREQAESSRCGIISLALP